MSTAGRPLDEVPTRELELLLASARDQYATAVNNWQCAVESDEPLAHTLPLAGAVDAADRRAVRILKELARRQQGAAA
ncbi:MULTISPECIES: hypothetical protein [Stenotrophomonas]|jgi:hypothetical protein|uniref:Uncharacterized protein n=1 Tax=Stenotrophomonas maltophilia TaxID=40324 RepID=A0A1V3D2L4_STEMA|nr:MULTISPECIES: hypothetical protein [Stenotrophomonas]OMP40019.1 hypothetical protein BMR86_09375 [Stenotrophomonas sp. KAs 5-3]AIL08056.1 hypothetical protein DP16_932 [Stenotrophomonas maltophilia]EKT2105283.1 hypothetical protein [Stenotrophomonas maltophilia]EKU9976005.1 hypothetical protein [Stenotrophomonas maltophilia]EKZ1927435.1 hypothetical protein [Stenotrophomonas maltophilia]